MSAARTPKRVSASAVAPLVIYIRGCKAIKDSDLATLFGMALPALYERLGRKLWRLQPTAFFQLPKAHDRGRLDQRPRLAFTQAGVIMVAGILGDDASLEIGMDIAHAMKNRQRSSAHKKRPSKRASDPDKAARYYQARAHMLQGRLHDLMKKLRRH